MESDPIFDPSAARAIGANVGFFKINDGDLVATIIGRNASGLGAVFKSLYNSPTLFMSCASSKHSSCAYFPG